MLSDDGTDRLNSFYYAKWILREESGGVATRSGEAF